MLLTPGTLLDGRYEVKRHLGDGAMGHVFEVRHVGLQSRHAIKVLTQALTNDPEIRQRFLAEGQIQAQLHHPNIASVTDVVTQPFPGLVMEYVEGHTLAQAVDSLQGPMPVDEIVAIAVPVMRAIAAAHSAGVVHRDLKPSNILLTRDAEGELRPVVVDFGIAKVLEHASVASDHRTRTGTLLGTLEYMSPEQVRRRSDIDARADVFALGAILYEMATGRAAFAADSEYATMDRIVQGEFEPPERVVDGLPLGLASCIGRALAPRRGDRFQSVTALREALQNTAGHPSAMPVESSGSSGQAIAEMAHPSVDQFSDRDHEAIERYLELAAKIRDRKNYTAAVELYDKVLELDEANVEAHIGLGAVHLQTPNYDAAALEFGRALKIDPDSPAGYLGMGEVHLLRKDYAAAIKQYNRCIALDDELGMAYRNRGLCFLYRRNHKRAFLDLQKAYRLEPEIPHIKEHLQEVMRALR